MWTGTSSGNKYEWGLVESILVLYTKVYFYYVFTYFCPPLYNFRHVSKFPNIIMTNKRYYSANETLQYS